ncbi:hypothetical protein, partial [Xanthomonas euvesicatoria]|uniref:hypothetical protein n=1 Tax=Xanthomonas euvesicatoria TaxID=456327 RepID=UPI001BAE6D07
IDFDLHRRRHGRGGDRRALMPWCGTGLGIRDWGFAEAAVEFCRCGSAILNSIAVWLTMRRQLLR